MRRSSFRQTTYEIQILEQSLRRSCMKLSIQIPCFNEESTLPSVLADLPKDVPGIDQIEILVIDDGSQDRTAEVAREHGVEHVVQHAANFGLARTFETGIRESLKRGADVIVNTDGDHQYSGSGIPSLVKPIVDGQADFVIGARPIREIEHFSPLKKLLQWMGSFVVRTVSGTDVPDAPSGFRAISRDAAMRLSSFGIFTYTLETLIQAGLSNLRVVSVPIGVNKPTRPSRLFRSQSSYIVRSITTILRTYVIYKPTTLFNVLAIIFGSLAALLSVRYLYFRVIGEGDGHVQSVIIAGVFAVCTVFMVSLGVTAHLLGINRRMLEEIRYRMRVNELDHVPNRENLAADENGQLAPSQDLIHGNNG